MCVGYSKVISPVFLQVLLNYAVTWVINDPVTHNKQGLNYDENHRINSYSDSCDNQI